MQRILVALDTSDESPLVLASAFEVDGVMRAGAILRRDHERLERTYDDLLAAYRSDDWEQVLAEHTELRRLLATLGVAVELHAFPAGDAEELLARLRDHGAREEKLLYPWMDGALDASKLHRLSA